MNHFVTIWLGILSVLAFITTVAANDKATRFVGLLAFMADVACFVYAINHIWNLQ